MLARHSNGMLAKPFLAQVKQSLVGGSALVVVQVMDKYKHLTQGLDILQEIARGAMEGATAEIIGAPIAIKGAQVFE